MRARHPATYAYPVAPAQRLASYQQSYPQVRTFHKVYCPRYTRTL